MNQTNTGTQMQPVNVQVNLTGPSWALAVLGIIGVITLAIFYTGLYDQGARGRDLTHPFLFGAGLIAVVALIIGRLMAQFLSLQIRERSKPQPEVQPQPSVQPTGQVRIQSPGISYPAGASVVEEDTRRIP
jgi:hypothetical protein